MIKPDTPEDTVEAVRSAIDAKSSLLVQGNGTKAGWGHPAKNGTILNLSGLSGVTLYEPEELVLSAAAGTPMAEIENLLDENNQHLAFEPPDFGRLYGHDPGAATLAGVIACNLSGPRRFQAGAARDHFLGFDAVNGRGEMFKSGGRVVKNVTGFDLSKLMAGSFGTLGVMTSITVKVMPAGEKTRTVLVLGLDNQKAMAVMMEALNSPHDINGAAHLPMETAAKSEVSYVSDAGAAMTAFRLQGPAPSVEARCGSLRTLLAGAGKIEELHFHNSKTLWTEIRDVAALLDRDDAAIWRLSVPPSRGADVTGQLEGDFYFDWGGGLIWLAGDAGQAEHIRSVVKECGGHATLMRAADDARSQIPVFHPQDPAVADLSRRLKQNFDPHNIFNPGRMIADED